MANNFPTVNPRFKMGEVVYIEKPAPAAATMTVVFPVPDGGMWKYLLRDAGDILRDENGAPKLIGENELWPIVEVAPKHKDMPKTKPLYRKGDVVSIRKIGGVQKTIVGPVPYGIEWKYLLRDEKGTLDEGWREDELTLVSRASDASFTDSITPILERRERVAQHIIKSLAHLPREHAMYLILSWFDIDELEFEVAPTLAGSPVPENPNDR